MIQKKTFLIQYHQGIINLYPYIVKYLKSKGFYVIFIVKTVQDVQFYQNKNTIPYDEIIHTAKKLEHKKDNELDKDYTQRVFYYEKKLKMPIYKIFFTDRTIGRGFFSSGGYNHPATKAQKIMKHEDLLKLAVERLDFWEDLFTSKNVKYAMNLPLQAHILAKERKIHSKRTIIGKFHNTRDWSSGLYWQPDDIDLLYKKSKLKNVKSVKSVKLVAPLDAHLRNKKLLIQEFSFFKTLISSMYFLIQHIYGRLKGNFKSKGIYILRGFKGFWMKRNHFLKLKKLVSINIYEAKKINYVYFPLITEPEFALHGIASDFFFQLSAINILSRDLPSNYKIIVKEHVLAVGRRPDQFYEQILSLKNVMLADSLELGLDYVKNAKIVACLTGTSMWEAAVLGIPVISFSKNNLINTLDHVHYISNFYNSHKVISQILKKNYPSKKSMKDGALFYKVYNANTLDMKNIMEFHSKAKTFINESNINIIYELVERFLKK